MKVRIKMSAAFVIEGDGDVSEIERKVRMHTDRWSEHLEASLVEHLERNVPGLEFDVNLEEDNES